MVHTFTNVCKRNLCKVINLWHEKPNNRHVKPGKLILDVALRLFSQQGVSSTSLATIAKAAGVTRGAIYWHFKNKSDLFNEIWELSDASISDLEIEYRAKFPNDPLSVIREILVYVLEATVTEERRRLMMEIIYHKCEFVGEMTVVQQAQRQLSLASYERIEQTLKECIAAKLLPANLLTRRAAVLMRSYLSGLMENWLFAPDSFDLHAEARDYVAILLEMYQFCPTLRGPESLSA